MGDQICEPEEVEAAWLFLTFVVNTVVHPVAIDLCVRSYALWSVVL
jgi:hypothetical protein